MAVLTTKLNISRVKELTWGTQPISSHGRARAQASSSGAATQYRRLRRMRPNSAKPRHPRAAMPDNIGSTKTGMTIQRTSASTKLKTRSTLVGLMGLRSFSVNQEAIVRAGVPLYAAHWASAQYTAPMKTTAARNGARWRTIVRHAANSEWD